MPQLSLDALISQANATMASLTTGTAALTGISETQQGFANENAQLYETIGSNAVIVETAKQNAELAVQQAKISAGLKLGTNLNDATEMITALSDTVRSEYAKKDAALKTIEEKQSVGFFDNPLEYIVNQFTINDDIARHNAANERVQAASAQIANLNALTQTTVQTQEAFKQSVTQSTIKATTDNIALTATVNANNQRVQGLVYNAEGIKAAMNAPKEALNIMFSVNGAQNAEQQIAISQAHLELARQEFDWRKEEKEKGKEADGYFIQKINEGMKLRLGDAADIIMPGSARANQVLALLKSNSPAGKQFQEDFMIGDQSDVAGTKVLATSPARAVEILNTMPVKLSPAANSVKDLLKNVLVDMNADAHGANPRVDLKNPASREAYINMRTREILGEMAKNVKPGDGDNVFNIGPVATIISASPTVQALPVVQKILAPAMATGFDANDPNKVFGLVATALRDGKISYSEALELTTLYHVGVTTNSEARQFISLGITPSFSYNTSLQTEARASFGGKQIVDLTKPDAIGRALNKFLATSAAASTYDTIDPFAIGSNIFKSQQEALTKQRAASGQQ